MAINASDNFFIKAKPVWAKGLETEKNITLGLYKKIFCKGENAVLKIAASGFYKAYLNGEFFYFGPARCAHGYYRVDEIRLPLKNGVNHIAIETVNYYVNSFYALMQKGFIEAELTLNGEPVAFTHESGENAFRFYRLCERIRKVQRYSYQRPFAEAYSLTEEYCGWRTGKISENASARQPVITESKNLLSRRIPLNEFTPVFTDRKAGFGTVKIGVKPEKYKKDRSLIYIKNPASGNLEGFFENELLEHLSDEAQEMPTETLNTEKADYSGKTVLKPYEFEILEFPCEKTGFITADIKCRTDSTVFFLFDEILTDNGDIDPLRLECCNVIKISLKPGEYHFMSAEPYGLKYIKLLCAGGGAEVDGLCITQTVCPVPITFDYKSDDEEINKILDAARETFIQNSFDLFTDCPTRERAGWLCDSFFLGRAEKLYTGENLIERNFLENFLLRDNYENIPSGMLPMCYPADVDGNGFIPNWAMWFILELKDFKERTDDGDFILRFKNKVYRLLEWFKQYENADGLLERLPGWVFIEWSKANDFVQDINFPSNMLYSYTLCAAGELFGDGDLLQKAEKVKTVIRNRSFDGEFFRDNEVYKNGAAVSTENRTETCQYYAFFTGVATKELYPELWQRLVNEFGPDRVKNGGYPEIYPSNAFIGNFLRLELLCNNGCYAKLLKEIKGYFLYMADITGTLWEHKDTCASCNHGFASYVANLIQKSELSLKP